MVSLNFIIQVKLNLIRTRVSQYRIVINLKDGCFVCTSVLCEINKPLETHRKNTQNGYSFLLVCGWVVLGSIRQQPSDENGDPGKGCEICETLKFRKLSRFFAGCLYTLYFLWENIASCDDSFFAGSHKALEFKILGNSSCKVVVSIKRIVYWCSVFNVFPMKL